MTDRLARALVSLLLRPRPARAGSRSSRAGAAAASAQPAPTCAPRCAINDPAAWRGAAARQHRPRRGLRRRPLGDRRPRRADADRRPRAARARRPARRRRPPPRPAPPGARPRPREHPRRGARSNIAAHYDLGNDLFAAFLDERMMYSCAYFPTPGRDPRGGPAGEARADLRAARLGPDDHLLEIGTGWGGLAIHAAATLRLPGDDDDDLARAARAGDRARARGRPRATGSRSCSRTTATSRAATTSSSRSR